MKLSALRTLYTQDSLFLMSLGKIYMYKDYIVIMGMRFVDLLNGEKDVLI